jgi:nitroreductase
MLQMGREGGMPEAYADQARTSVPNYLSSFSEEAMHGWLNKMVMIAFTHMMLMAEVTGYDTAPLEGFEQDKVHEVLRLPMSYWVVALLAIGHAKGPDTVFGEEYGKPLK